MTTHSVDTPSTTVSRLPYGQLVPSQSKARVTLIVERLREAIIQRDPNRSGAFYASHLRKHIHMKEKIEDGKKVELVDLLLNLMVMPETSATVQSKYAQVLLTLTKKCKKVSLNLSWKPFYHLLLQSTTDPRDLYQAVLPNTTNAVTLVHVIQQIKKHFAPSAGAEILSEFLPKLNVHDNKSIVALGHLSTFYYPRDTATDYVALLTTFVDIWGWIDNSRAWDVQWSNLTSKILKKHHLQISTAPSDLVSKLYTLYLRMTNVTLGTTSLPKPENRTIPKEYAHMAQHQSTSTNIAKSMLYMLNMTSQPSTLFQQKAQECFDLYIDTIASYYYPSNSGSWNDFLSSLLLHISHNALKRSVKEQVDRSKLESFGAKILPVIYQAMYSKHNGMIYNAREALTTISRFLPQLVFSTLVPKIDLAFRNFQWPHQTLAVMEVLGCTIGEMINQRNFADGIQAFPRFLHSAILSIDTNDIEKTKAAFKVIYRFLSFVPFAAASMSTDDAMEDDNSAAAASFVGNFEDLSLTFLDACFALYHNQDKDQHHDGWWYYIQESTFRLFFEGQSAEIYRETSRKLADYVLQNTANNAKKEFGYIISGCVAANPETALQLFLPKIYKDLVNNSGELKELSDSELEWKLFLAASVVDFGGVHLLKHKELLIALIKACWSRSSTSDSGQPKKQKRSVHYSKDINKSAGQLLRAVISSLSHMWPLHFRDERGDGWRGWGEKKDLKDTNIQWHTPSAEEMSMARSIYNDLFSLARSRFHDNQSDRETIALQLDLLHHLVHSSQNLFPALPKTGDSSVYNGEDKSYATIPFESGKTDGILPESSLTDLAVLLHEMFATINRDHADDVESGTKLIGIYLTYLTSLHGHYHHFSTRYSQIWHKYKHPIRTEEKKNSAPLLIDKVYSAHLNRCSTKNTGVLMTDQVKELIHDLLLWSHSSYREVRKSAQQCLEKSFKSITFSFSYVFNHVDLPSVLSRPDATKYQVKAAAHIMNSRFAMERIIRNVNFTLRFVEGLTNSHVHDDRKIQGLLYTVYVSFIARYYPSDQFSRHYSAFNSTMTKLLSRQNSSQHWRYRLMSLGFIYVLSPRLQRLEHGFSIENYQNILRRFSEDASADLPALRSIAIMGLSSLLRQLRRKDLSPAAGPLATSSAEFIRTYFSDPTTLRKMLSNMSLDHQLSSKESEMMEAGGNRNSIANILQKVASGVGGEEETANFVLKAVLRNNKESFQTSFAYNQPKSLFSERNASLWRGIFSAWRNELSPSLVAEMSTLARSKENEDQIVLSEMLAGLIRAAKSSPELVSTVVAPVLVTVMSEVSTSSSLEWSDSLRFGVSGQSDALIAPILRNLLEISTIQSQGRSSAALMRQLLSLKSILTELGTSPLNLEVLKGVFSMHNEYKQVSQGVGEILSIIFYNLWNPTSLSPAKIYPELKATAVEISEKISPDAMVTEQRSLYSTMMLSLLSYSSTTGHVQALLPYIDHLQLANVFSLAKETDEDMYKQTAHSLALLSQSKFQGNFIDVITDVLEKTGTQNPAWNVRKLVLPFLQIFAFNSRFECSPEQKNRILQLVVSLLSDSRVEVRELAKGTLSSLLHGVADSSELQRKMVEMSRTPAGKPNENSTNLIRRHAGTLGLCSLILSQPYDVPSWLPQITSELSVHMNDPTPIRESVRATFADFWRTHLDEWEINFKEKFDQTQLDNLAETRHTHNYYA